MKKKITAIIAIMLCVFTLGLSVSPAFAAAPASTTDTTPWSNFPVQQRYSYNEYYTLAIQTVLYYSKSTYAYYLGSIDGKFGPDTQTVVRLFQTDKGLTVNGTVNSETWAALYDCLVKDTEPPFPIVPNSLYVVPDYYKVRGSGIILFRCSTSTNTWSVATNPGAVGIDIKWQQFNPEV